MRRFAAFRADRITTFMIAFTRRMAPAIFACAAMCVSLAAVRHLRATEGHAETRVPAGRDDAQALRLNTLGVAYMNQQRSADAQKLFEQALQADPNFAVAKVNL